MAKGQNENPDGGYSHFHESGQKSPHGGKLVGHVPTAAAGHGKNGEAPGHKTIGKRQMPQKREIPSGLKPPAMNSDSMEEPGTMDMGGQSMLGWNQ